MDRVNAILQHPEFRRCMEELLVWERDRVWCGHGWMHLLDTARLAWIFNLEGELGLDRDVVYAAALLHDVGRSEQYESGIPHAQAGARIAEPILADCGFAVEERGEILYAIASHSKRELSRKTVLADLLYRADKASRACFACPVEPACDWPSGKKNKELRY